MTARLVNIYLINIIQLLFEICWQPQYKTSGNSVHIFGLLKPVQYYCYGLYETN